ncbi:hypothetical protein [Paenarthrobacter sp. NPDC090522]
MTDHDDFLAWVRADLYQAERALHNGDAAPRRFTAGKTVPGGWPTGTAIL